MVGSEKTQVTTAAKTSDFEKLLKAYQSGKLENLVDLIEAQASEQAKMAASDDKKDEKEDKPSKARKAFNKQYKEYLDQKVKDEEITKTEADEIKASLKKKSANDLRGDLQKEQNGIIEELRSQTLKAQLEGIDIRFIETKLQIFEKEMERTRQYYAEEKNLTEEEIDALIQEAPVAIAEKEKELTQLGKAKNASAREYIKGKEELLNSLRASGLKKKAEVQRLKQQIFQETRAVTDAQMEVDDSSFSKQVTRRDEELVINNDAPPVSSVVVKDTVAKEEEPRDPKEVSDDSSVVVKDIVAKEEESGASEEVSDQEGRVLPKGGKGKEKKKKLSKKEKKAKARYDELTLFIQRRENNLSVLKKQLDVAQKEEKEAFEKLASIKQKIKDLESGQKVEDEELKVVTAFFAEQQERDEEFVDATSQSRYIEGTRVIRIPVLVEEKNDLVSSLNGKELEYEFQGGVGTYTVAGHKTIEQRLKLRIEKLEQYKNTVDGLLDSIDKNLRSNRQSNEQATGTNFLADYKKYLLRTESGVTRHLFMINFFMDSDVISYALGVGKVPVRESKKEIQQEPVNLPENDELDQEKEAHLETNGEETPKEKARRLNEEIDALRGKGGNLLKRRQEMSAKLISEQQNSVGTDTKQVTESDLSLTLKDEILIQLSEKLKKQPNLEYILLNMPRLILYASNVFEVHSIAELSKDCVHKLCGKLCQELFQGQSAVVAKIIYDMSLSWMDEVKLTSESLRAIASLSEKQQQLLRILRRQASQKDTVPVFALENANFEEVEIVEKAVRILSPLSTPLSRTPQRSPSTSVPGTPKSPSPQRKTPFVFGLLPRTPQKTPRSSPPLTPISSKGTEQTTRLFPVTVDGRSYDDWLKDMENFETRCLAFCLDKVRIPPAPMREVRTFFSGHSHLFATHSTVSTAHNENDLVSEVAADIIDRLESLKRRSADSAANDENLLDYYYSRHVPDDAAGKRPQSKSDQKFETIFSGKENIVYSRIGAFISSSLKEGKLNSCAKKIGLSDADIIEFRKQVWFQLEKTDSPDDLAYKIVQEMIAFRDYKQKMSDSLRDCLAEDLQMSIDDKITSEETLARYCQKAVRQKYRSRSTENKLRQWGELRDEHLTEVMREEAESAIKSYDSSCGKSREDVVVEKTQAAINHAAIVFDQRYYHQFMDPNLTTEALSESLRQAKNDLKSSEDEVEEKSLRGLVVCFESALSKLQNLEKDEKLDVEAQLLNAAKDLLRSSDPLTEQLISDKALELATLSEKDEQNITVANEFIKNALTVCLESLLYLKEGSLYQYIDSEQRYITQVMASIASRLVLRGDGIFLLLGDDTFPKIEDGLFEKMQSGVYRKLSNGIKSFMAEDNYEKQTDEDGNISYIVSEKGSFKLFDGSRYMEIEEGRFVKSKDGTYQKFEGELRELQDIGNVHVQKDGSFVLSQGGSAQYPINFSDATLTAFAIQQKYRFSEIKAILDSTGRKYLFKIIQVREMPKPENEKSSRGGPSSSFDR